MKYTIRLVVCPMLAFAALAFAAVADASAFTVWQDNGTALTTTENTNLTLDPSTPLTLTDTGVGVTITCTSGVASVSSSGTVGAGGTDTVASATANNCTSSDTSLCPDPVTAQAANTPWTTQIDGTRDDITNSGDDVGWTVTCANGVTDTCTATSSSAALANVAASGSTSGYVTATFDLDTPIGNCSLGGTGTGEVSGPVDIFLTNGHNLSVG